MSFAIQDIIVTLLALASAVIIVRRLVGTFSPSKPSPACSNCASGAAACAKAAHDVAAAPADDRPVPLILHRR